MKRCENREAAGETEVKFQAVSDSLRGKDNLKALAMFGVKRRFNKVQVRRRNLHLRKRGPNGLRVDTNGGIVSKEVFVRGQGISIVSQCHPKYGKFSHQA